MHLNTESSTDLQKTQHVSPAGYITFAVGVNLGNNRQLCVAETKYLTSVGGKSWEDHMIFCGNSILKISFLN